MEEMVLELLRGLITVGVTFAQKRNVTKEQWLKIQEDTWARVEATDPENLPDAIPPEQEG